jgi:hypothetical protein
LERTENDVTFELQALFAICRHDPLSKFWPVDTIFDLRRQSSLWLLISGHYFLSADMILSVDLIRRHNPLCDFWAVDPIFHLRTQSSLWILIDGHYFLSADMILC